MTGGYRSRVEADQFNALYASLQRRLFAYAASQLSPQEAADVVADTFEVVWRKRDGAPADPDEWPAWCFGIARNKVLQARQRRRRKHHDARFVEDHLALGIQPATREDVAATTVRSVHAARVWQELPATDRELLGIVLTTEAPGHEVAAQLGTSYSAYATRVSRLRQKLGRLLDHDHEREGERS